MSNNGRLHSLDTLRGLTICAMIIVNCAGSWGCVYAPLAHSPWNGITFADLIFPMFMFIMGTSLYISLRKSGFQLSGAVARHILRRTVLLYAVGTAIYAIDGVMHSQSLSALAEVRLSGVLERLALCYGIVALMAVTIRHRYFPHIIAAILVGYFALLLLGNGFVYGPENLLARVDYGILGCHMYFDNGIDPEGLLSTIPAVAQTLIGFLFGKICFDSTPLTDRLVRLFAYGAVCLLSGLLLADICPLNKKVWSPTFVLATCGFSALTLGLLMWAIDLRRLFGGIFPADVVGVNPLFCYVGSELLYILADSLSIGGRTVHDLVYSTLIALVGDNPFASLLYALLFLAAIWLVALALYRRRIYIKL